jgi:hypothetical protein
MEVNADSSFISTVWEIIEVNVLCSFISTEGETLNVPKPV